MAERRWFIELDRAGSAGPRLVVFAHAGGQPSVFAGLAPHLPDDVELLAAHLPGRGRRVGEAPIADLDRLLDALGPRLARLLDDRRPTVLLGHSMGSVLAFELCRWLAARGRRRPAHLVVVGHRPPHAPLGRPPVHAAPDTRMLAELCRQGGTPGEVLDSAEMMQVLLPMIRADYAVAETWLPGPDARVDVPLTAVGGWSDAEVHPRALEGWGRHTDAGFAWHVLEGGHFFLHERPHTMRPILKPIFEGLLGAGGV